MSLLNNIQDTILPPPQYPAYLEVFFQKKEKKPNSYTNKIGNFHSISYK